MVGRTRFVSRSNGELIRLTPFQRAVFYLRIVIERWQRILLKTIMVVVVLFGIAYGACLIFQCWPIKFTWYRYATSYEGHCAPPGVVLGGTYAQSALSALVDWTLATLPIVILRHSNMTIQGKLAITFLLSLGAVSVQPPARATQNLLTPPRVSLATLVRISCIHQMTEYGDFLCERRL